MKFNEVFMKFLFIFYLRMEEYILNHRQRVVYRSIYRNQGRKNNTKTMAQRHANCARRRFLLD